jgi:hypothetical protein
MKQSVSWHKSAATAILLLCSDSATGGNCPAHTDRWKLIDCNERLQRQARQSVTGDQWNATPHSGFQSDTAPSNRGQCEAAPKSTQRGAKSPNPFRSAPFTISESHPGMPGLQARAPILISQGRFSKSIRPCRCLVKLRPETCTLASPLKSPPASSTCKPAIGHSLHFILLILAPEPIAATFQPAKENKPPNLSEPGSAVGARQGPIISAPVANSLTFASLGRAGRLLGASSRPLWPLSGSSPADHQRSPRGLATRFSFSVPVWWSAEPRSLRFPFPRTFDGRPGRPAARKQQQGSQGFGGRVGEVSWPGALPGCLWGGLFNEQAPPPHLSSPELPVHLSPSWRVSDGCRPSTPASALPMQVCWTTADCSVTLYPYCWWAVTSRHGITGMHPQRPPTQYTVERAAKQAPRPSDDALQCTKPPPGTRRFPECRSRPPSWVDACNHPLGARLLICGNKQFLGGSESPPSDPRCGSQSMRPLTARTGSASNNNTTQQHQQNVPDSSSTPHPSSPPCAASTGSAGSLNPLAPHRSGSSVSSDAKELTTGNRLVYVST